MVLLFDV